MKKRGSSCKTTDELRDFIYHHSKANELPPTSKETRWHILRALYATNQMKNGLSSEQSADPTLYGYQVIDDLLIPKRGRNPFPEEWTVKCWCLKCSSEQRCACRSSHRSCCSFCKCRRVSSMSECKNPIC